MNQFVPERELRFSAGNTKNDRENIFWRSRSFFTEILIIFAEILIIFWPPCTP